MSSEQQPSRAELLEAIGVSQDDINRTKAVLDRHRAALERKRPDLLARMDRALQRVSDQEPDGEG